MDLDNSIESIVSIIENGWNEKNGEKYSEAFTEDAEFTSITGKYLSGKNEITEWHNDIFEGVYSNTMLKVTVERTRQITDEIASVDSHFEFLQKGGTYFAPGWVLSHAVLKNTNEGWKILQLNNTVPYEPSR